MTPTTVIAGIAFLMITLVVLGFPFIQQGRSNDLASAIEQKKRDELLTSYERILATIRDLDEDHQTGKILLETYQNERSYWTEQGILLLKQLEDEDDGVIESESGTETTESDKAMDDAVEKAIAEYREAQI